MHNTYTTLNRLKRAIIGSNLKSYNHSKRKKKIPANGEIQPNAGFCVGGDEGDRTPYLLNAIQNQKTTKP